MKTFFLSRVVYRTYLSCIAIITLVGCGLVGCGDETSLQEMVSEEALMTAVESTSIGEQKDNLDLELQAPAIPAAPYITFADPPIASIDTHAQSNYYITGAQEVRAGRNPNHNLEAFGQIVNKSCFLVGIGVRAGSDNIVAIRLLYIRLKPDGTFGEYINVRVGRKGNKTPEAWYQVPYGRVITGLGLRCAGDDIRTMVVHSRRWDRGTGRLVEPKTHRAGKRPDHSVEVEIRQPLDDLEHTVVRGVGARVASDDVTTLKLVYGVVTH